MAIIFVRHTEAIGAHWPLMLVRHSKAIGAHWPIIAVRHTEVTTAFCLVGQEATDLWL